MAKEKTSKKKQIKLLHQLEQTICECIDTRCENTKEERLISAWNVLMNLIDESKVLSELGLDPASSRGLMAEIMLKYVLEEWSKNNDKKFIYKSNLLLPKSDGKGTTQLDGVYITNNFALVIECKSYYGQLTIEDGNVSSKTNSSEPWKQNYGHIIALKKVLEDYSIYFGNVVYIFSQGIITYYKSRAEEFLMVNANSMKLLDELSSYEMLKNNLSDSDLDDIDNILSEYIPTVEQEEEHIEYIKSILSNC